MTDTVVAEIALLIDCPGWSSALIDVAALAEHAARAALDGAVEDGVVLDGPVEFSVVLADDARVQALNARWRGQDKPTNVLSFAARDADDSPLPPGQPEPLGDIIVAFETTSREAAEQGKRLSDHLCHLIVHGVLHLLGYDHLDDAEAEEMEALERIILADLGVPDPYADAGTPGMVPVDGQ